ncbi:hypothetical protein NLU13_9556 [Sarocladium strictum]|uniref:Uncharacterized protein n=1 Tax=Sarocladium strictum TaxID=5046 RepID=A0AA39L4H2_SARSR|nr:hypothetical protein NLU13_9556 [Sarocladium strictum]
MEDKLVLGRSASGSSGLGLGWVLFIALGGGALSFLALGFLLTWYLKRRAAPCTTRVYSWNGIPHSNSQPQQLPRGSTHRLLKKRLLANSESELAGSGWSSRMSLSFPVLPPILPLPRHHSFRGRRRTRSWVNEEEIHGPQIVRRSWRESWFGGEGRLGRSPTVPDLNALEAGNGSSQQEARLGHRATASEPCTPQRRHPMGAWESPQHFQRHPQAQTPTRNPSLQMPNEGRIEVQKRDDRLQQHQIQATRSAPDLGEEYRGRVRMPAQAHIRPRITDTDLRDILHMTEQRLRDGTSQSPNKTTPRTSPSKRSPVKTPRSYRPVSRPTPSPSKKTPGTQSNTTQSRNASVSSIGSAANSLLAEATQELELPGGMSSPSRLKGREWSAAPELPPSDSIQSAQQRSPTQMRYRKSMDSDVSSSLSTLYSAGEAEEPEEPHGLAVRNACGDDPFVDHGERRSPSWETKQLASDPRAFRRRTDVVSAADPASSPVCSSACPSPLRPISTADPHNAKRNSMNWIRQSLVLQPPTVRQCDDVQPKADSTVLLEETMRQVSESSMESVSVHTDDSDATELPVLMSSAKKTKEDEHHDDDTSSSSRPVTPTTPVRKHRSVDMSSSPYNEEDILHLLLSSAGPKRALPLPPPRVEGADYLGPTQLSPRPRSKARTYTRQVSAETDSSSNYEQQNFADEDTIHPIIVAPSPQTLNVTNTISELRRMNSMISSYSAASIASTTLGEMESAAIPALRGGGFSPSRSQSRASLLGKKNYLSIGDHSPKKKTVSPHQRTNSKKSLKATEDNSPEKENKGHGIKVSRKTENGSTDSPNSGLREAKCSSGPRSRAVSRENSASARGSPVSRKEKKRLNPVDELVSEDKRLSRVSVDSLGLYDKDGFLVGSPEREKCLRM